MTWTFEDRQEGGDGAGGAASAAPVDALARLEPVVAAGPDLLGMLADAVADADRAVRRSAATSRSTRSRRCCAPAAGSRWCTSAISRAYALRDGERSQLTRDHTYVQSRVDQGRLGAQEVATHPQRALLVRALGAGGTAVEADTERDQVVGQRRA
ncbi:hypothetical protein OG470_31810 [Micromonospora sp. NBC_00389]|uniref:PP2C family protein-serine/threonine phosphatase n=1 Tax=Micromonospora sp. NBC_00389 TaxID=2903586 RepID=UPI002E1D7603